MVYKDQATAAKAPAFVQVAEEDFAGFDLVTLAGLTGMSLAAANPKKPPGKPQQPPMQLKGGVGGKWCSKCPHPEGTTCFLDPNWEGPFPVWLHQSAEKKKPFLKGRVTNAKTAGIKCADIKPPSDEAIEAYNARRARFNGGRGGGRGGRNGRAGGRESLAGGAAVEMEEGASAFYENLVDITDVDVCGAALCSECDCDEHLDVAFVGADGEEEADGQADFLWFVTRSPQEGTQVQAAFDASELELPDGSACWSFGCDEGAARDFAANQQRAGPLPINLAAAEPSPSHRKSTSSQEGRVAHDTPVPVSTSSKTGLPKLQPPPPLDDDEDVVQQPPPPDGAPPTACSLVFGSVMSVTSSIMAMKTQSVNSRATAMRVS